MLRISTYYVAGFRPAIRGMRNPMDSWPKSDSNMHDLDIGYIGENDKDLSKRLSDSGEEHAKHLRMVMVWADITAPRFWWNEFDTYRIGVEKVSCSTMHKLASRPLTVDDFTLKDNEEEEWMKSNVIPRLNMLMEAYKGEQEPHEKRYIWRKLIHELPQSYMQMRTVMMSYAALRNIYKQREGHKLYEWEEFRRWCKELPESWMITE